MQDILIALIFGFGLVSVALVLSVLGILNYKSWLVIIGAVLFTPFSYYLFGASRANVFALIPVLLQFGAAVAVQGKKTFWAWILLAPSFLTVFWVLGVALYYQVQ